MFFEMKSLLNENSSIWQGFSWAGKSWRYYRVVKGGVQGEGVP